MATTSWLVHSYPQKSSSKIVKLNSVCLGLHFYSYVLLSQYCHQSLNHVKYFLQPFFHLIFLLCYNFAMARNIQIFI